MFRPLIAVAAALLAAVPAVVCAMDPGEWQFTTTMSAPNMPKSQVMTNTRCIKKEDAGDPSRYMNDAKKQSDCKMTSNKKSGDTYSWEMSCPSSGMQGTGTVKQTATTMEAEMTMKGQKMEMRSQTVGKRLGACKAG
ncbi:MAG: DUF3617 domain-containing protein [Burkholderiales bacterium]